MCPVCQSKITQKRRVELCEAVSNWKDKGGSVSLLTVTVRHHKKDIFAKSLDGLTDAYRKLLNSNVGKRIFKTLGVHGRVRGLEVTYGENGWHPHFHVLLFLESNPSAELLTECESLLLDLWKTVCLASGLNAPNSHGLTLKNGTYAAQYVSKWGIEDEITKGHIKKSVENYGPNDLLRFHLGTYAGNAKPLAPGQARILFIEYARTMKGKRQLHWSKGLRDQLGLGKEKTDEQLVDEVEIQEVLFAKIPNFFWKVILQAEKRAEVLESCRLGIDNFYAYCESIALKHDKDKKDGT